LLSAIGLFLLQISVFPDFLHDGIQRFILANGKLHPRRVGVAEMEAFLWRLANEDNVAANAWNQVFHPRPRLEAKAAGSLMGCSHSVQRAWPRFLFMEFGTRSLFAR
jgi:hypothetical protein